MRISEYESITAELFKVRKKRNDCVKYLNEKYPSISHDTISSIYSQVYQRKIKKDYPKHHKRSTINKYIQQYHFAISRREREGFVSRLADKIDFPATLLARIILEEILKENSQSNVSKALISQCIKQPQNIPDKVLSREVEICVHNDQLCGPLIESIKREIGLKYEKVLHDTLMQRDIAYYHEDTLRKEGYDKTPDFKLVVPI